MADPIDINIPAPEVQITVFGNNGASGVVAGIFEGIGNFFGYLAEAFTNESKSLNSIAWIVATIMTVLTIIWAFKGVQG